MLALDMELVALALAAMLLLTLILRRHGGSAGSSKHGRLPPSPMALPVIGHLHLIRSPPHRSFDRILARHGPFIYLRLGPSTHCVVVGSADVARDFLRFEASIPERPLTAVTRLLAYGSAGFAFAPYGPHWRFVKRLCMSELLGPRTVEQLRPVRDAELASVLRAARAAAERGESVDMSRELIRMSNNAIMRMVASALPGDMAEAARDCAKQVAELVGAFNVEDYVALCRGWDLQGIGRRTREVHARFDALLEVMIRAKEEARRDPHHGKGKTTKDLLDILMDAAEDEAAEVRLTRENIKAFVLDIFTAGSDTTATSVEWMLAELINHPACLEKLRAEVDAVVGGSRLVGEADVARLPYLQAVLKETLRLRPPAVFVQRETIEAVHVRGYTIPPRRLLQHLLHRARPGVLGGPTRVPAGALHARRGERRRRTQGAAPAAHAVRERPPRLPRHGPRHAGRAGVPRDAGAVLRLGGAAPAGDAAGHGGEGGARLREEAAARARPHPAPPATPCGSSSRLNDPSIIDATHASSVRPSMDTDPVCFE